MFRCVVRIRCQLAIFTNKKCSIAGGKYWPILTYKAIGNHILRVNVPPKKIKNEKNKGFKKCVFSNELFEKEQRVRELE